MADTQARIFVDNSAWVEITNGPITGGMLSPESQTIRVAISTGTEPASLTQGHKVNPNDRITFTLDLGETLYAVASGTSTSIIATY